MEQINASLQPIIIIIFFNTGGNLYPIFLIYK